MISIPSFAPSASKPHDKDVKREQNPRYTRYNGLNEPSVASHTHPMRYHDPSGFASISSIEAFLLATGRSDAARHRCGLNDPHVKTPPQAEGCQADGAEPERPASQFQV
jgi:hypothetical protein